MEFSVRLIISQVRKDGFHHLRISRHLLLVTRSKGCDLDPGEKLVDLVVAERGTFDPGERADTFDGRNAAARGRYARWPA